MSTLSTYNVKNPDSASDNLQLDSNGYVAVQAGAVSTPSLYITGDANTGLWAPTADTLAVSTGGSERVRVDSSGRLLVGTSTSTLQGSGAAATQQIATFGTVGTLAATNYGSGSAPYGSHIWLGASRGSTAGSATAVQSGDRLGEIRFFGGDGTDLDSQAAWISCYVDGTPGADDMPGRLVFSTTADGGNSPTERMRIQSNGALLVGKTTTVIGTAGIAVGVNDVGATQTGAVNVTVDGEDCVYINRLTSDGNLISFRQDGSQEGTISVSGTTVSYNGAHLSRWSQLPSGAERIEILRGSVLSNINEMCEWGDEENEQLNRMKVSDVEGDKNVSGVFQAWDDDDDTYTNDFYCAMTGDFIIRIGAGVTVERGDLLMSAGDGTAKPQDDDIIRSKTIAKVTSTNVSCTYDDGSYCVPCVLMAC